MCDYGSLYIKGHLIACTAQSRNLHSASLERNTKVGPSRRYNSERNFSMSDPSFLFLEAMEGAFPSELMFHGSSRPVGPSEAWLADSSRPLTKMERHPIMCYQPRRGRFEVADFRPETSLTAPRTKEPFVVVEGTCTFFLCFSPSPSFSSYPRLPLLYAG